MKPRRTFVGFHPFGSALEELVRLQSELKSRFQPKSCRWIAPESLHLTLHFIGPTSSKVLERLLPSLASLREAERCEQNFDSFLGFPSKQRARVAGIGAKSASPGLQTLWKKTGELLSQSEVSLEGRSYIPHISMLRMGKSAPIPGWDFAPFELLIDRVALFESRLGGGPARYEIIEEFPLAATESS